MTRLEFYTIAMLVAAISAIGGLIWWNTRPAPWELAHTPPGLLRIDKVDITVPKVKVYAPKAKKSLKLPPPIQDNPDKHVIAATDCGDRVVTALLDSGTGETEMLVQVKPLPWIARESAWAVRLDHDFRDKVQVLTVRYDALQVKAIHFGASAAVDTNLNANARVGVEWRF